MGQKVRIFILIIPILIGCNTYPQQAILIPEQLVGSWEGSLTFNSITLRMVFHLEQNESGNLGGTLDSPDLGATGIAISEVKIDSNTINISIRSIGGTYIGEYNDQTKEIKGTWKQGTSSLPLILKPQVEEVVLNRPQEPKPPYPYNIVEVSFENVEAGVSLAGTLIYPKGETPFTAVILISGSGPQNRDEEVFQHKPFLVLADHLVRQGIAVLRYDDRGIGESTGNFSAGTSKDFANDAWAAFQFVKEQKYFNTTKIGLAGHSEGGLIASMIAAEHEEIDFIVLMAGPGLTGEEIIYLQSALIARANGASEEEISRSNDLNKRLFEAVKSEPDRQELSSKIETIINDYVANLPESEKSKPENNRETLNARAARVTKPWFRYFLTYDPSEALSKIKCPVLAVNGEKDLLVTPKENLKAIQKALKTVKNKDFIIKEIKGLNHLFQTANTGSPSEYVQIEETFSPQALSIISEWINQR